MSDGAAAIQVVPAIEDPRRVDALFQAFERACAASLNTRYTPPPMPLDDVTDECAFRFKLAGIDLNIRLDEYSTGRWTLNPNQQAAFAQGSNGPVLLRQWYARRRPAPLSRAEVAQVTSILPLRVRAALPRAAEAWHRLYILVADLSHSQAEIAARTQEAIDLLRRANEIFGTPDQ
ncbi:hypothetical protein [Roseomonas sp. CECT 9278]|uniref:hypothetical protein n=1 Tax=Roseomonas sp. CECT 9278 TaxID=2845823 RepID=UPI001E59645D|nr:hypothetical protein [Roseomonas sp. CECT 9278]CAH0222585.1 hypothetical protein ROS9278_02448 [Roseomonas sp. CECT 9278]